METFYGNIVLKISRKIVLIAGIDIYLTSLIDLRGNIFIRISNTFPLIPKGFCYFFRLPDFKRTFVSVGIAINILRAPFLQHASDKTRVISAAERKHNWPIRYHL